MPSLKSTQSWEAIKQHSFTDLCQSGGVQKAPVKGRVGVRVGYSFHFNSAIIDFACDD